MIQGSEDTRGIFGVSANIGDCVVFSTHTNSPICRSASLKWISTDIVTRLWKMFPQAWKLNHNICLFFSMHPPALVWIVSMSCSFFPTPCYFFPTVTFFLFNLCWHFWAAGDRDKCLYVFLPLLGINLRQKHDLVDLPVRELKQCIPTYTCRCLLTILLWAILLSMMNCGILLKYHLSFPFLPYPVAAICYLKCHIVCMKDRDTYIANGNHNDNNNCAFSSTSGCRLFSPILNV